MLSDRLIAALFAALLTGITFIAYKHPDGYKRMYWPLVIALWAVSALAGAFIIGRSVGNGDATLEILKLNPNIRTPNMTIPSPLSTLGIGMIPVIAYGYLLFLRFLPDILHSPEKKEGKQPKDELRQKDSSTNP
jgi:hypothetical protein